MPKELVMIYNDLIEENIDEDFKIAAKKIVRDVGNEKGLDLAVHFYKLTNYWNVIRHGSPIVFSEIRNGIEIYDPTGFFRPLKKLLELGRIPGTKEAMRALIISSPKRVIKVKELHKSKIISEIYDAVISAGQAILITEGVSPPIPKKIPEKLRQHLVKSNEMLEKDVVKCEEIIKVWKNYEHGNKIELEGKEIDKLVAKGMDFIDEVEELMIEKLKNLK